MNYLNEEYKNLSDLDKKNILPGIIKFLLEEKQKVDDKINGAENGKVFLRRLEIEESDMLLTTEGMKEEIERCQKFLVELKEKFAPGKILDPAKSAHASGPLIFIKARKLPRARVTN